jgi:acetylornithine deacetylase
MTADGISRSEKEWAPGALKLLKELIACDTTDYHEANGQELVGRVLNDLGCTARSIRPDPEVLKGKYPEFNAGHTYDEKRACLVSVFKGTGGGRSLIINSHIDTVFPAAPEKWETDPFTPTEKDGRVYGLGACDTKAGMAAVLTALKCLADLGIGLKGDVIFQSVVDEEAGGGNGTLACLDAGYRADAVLVTEPNGLIPASAHIGSYAAKITVYGKSAHGNLKHEGISAFEKALPLILKLEELEKKWKTHTHEILPSPVLTILGINAGDGSVTIPESCEMFINYTYLPNDYDYEGELRSVIRTFESGDPWFADHPVKFALQHNVTPYYTSPDSPWPLLAADCASLVLGRRVKPTGLPCGADARFYSNLGHMDTIVLGPGSISNAHKPNEFVEIGDFISAVKIYAEILRRWCGERG